MAARALDSYQSLVKEIRGGQIAPLYLFHGEEQVLAEYVVTVLEELLMPDDMRSVNFLRLDGLKMTEAEFIRAVETPPMFGERRLVLVDQPFFVKSKKEGQTERLAGLFADWPAFTCGVMLCSELDKRLKLVKQLTLVAKVYEFPALTAVEASQWVDERLRKAGIRTRGLGRLIVERAGNNLRILRLEVDKVIAYADGAQVEAGDIEFLVRNNMETSVFDLVDAVGQRQLERALQLVDELHTQGQEPLYVLAMIGRQLRLLLVARLHLDQGQTNQEAAAALGIHPFPAGKCVTQAKIWSQGALRQAIAGCLAADEAIKTGQLPGRRAVDRLLLELARA